MLSKSINIQADLHCHTLYSDGTLSPEQVLNLAKDQGLQMLAFTDHDNVAAYNTMLKATDSSVISKRYGLQLISGCEFSTHWQGVGVHIVGLNFCTNHPAIKSLITYQQQARTMRLQRILKKLAAADMPLSLDEINQQIQEQNLKENRGQIRGQIGRPHIAKALVEKGYVNNEAKAFKKYLGQGKLGDIHSDWARLSDIIDAVKKAGGVTVIAHPAYYKMTRSKLLRFIGDFVDCGGQGIEVVTARQQPEQIEKFANLAKQFNLYASLGSDFHRLGRYQPMLGRLPALPECVQPIWQQFN